jgi:hypothetical protein
VGSNVARGVAAASIRAVVAEAREGVPQAADSSTGRPKPSAVDRHRRPPVTGPEHVVSDRSGHEKPMLGLMASGRVDEPGAPLLGEIADDDEVQVDS